MTAGSIADHGIQFDEVRGEDRTETYIEASKGPHKGKLGEVHAFSTPTGEEVHGIFPVGGRAMGALPYKQHPHFPGKRVYESGISSVIGKYKIPETNIFGGSSVSEGYGSKKKMKKKNYTQKEIQEATMARINNIGKGGSGFESHPGLGRF